MYLTQSLKEAIIRFRRAIARRQGLSCILGANGMGKSSLLRYLASGYESDEERYSVSYFHDTRKFKTTFEFLKMITADLGIPPKRSQTAQMGALEELLANNNDAGRTTLVFIDEGQRLSLDSLELVRALLNYETNTHKFVQVVISGQIELRDRLLERQYKAFRSRIVAPLIMQRMIEAETRAMIEFRLDGWGVPNPFTPAAVTRIHELADGVPRDVLSLCQQACDMAHDDGNGSHVSVTDVELAFGSLQLDRAVA